jgi:hypothetical protein
LRRYFAAYKFFAVKKKVILVLIILIPSLIYFFFEYSEVNFKKMAYYGPKTIDAKGDTIYYSVPESALEFGKIWEESEVDSLGRPYSVAYFDKDVLKKQSGAQLVLFVDKNQQEKLAGLLEFEKYKKEKLDMLDVYIIQFQSPDALPNEKNSNYYESFLKDSLSITMSNFFYRTLCVKEREEYDSIRKIFFTQKPIHVFNYFAVLVDKDRHIRGYYDPTYISEVKRMIEEYKHLVLKDEHANMQDVNKIEKK